MLYQTLIIFIGIVIGIVTAIVLFWSFKYRDIQDEEGNKPGFLRRGIVGRQVERKRRNLEKLKGYINDKKEITNDEAQKLLGVSRNTVIRYLDKLEQEGVVEQIGDTGRGTYYRKINAPTR